MLQIIVKSLITLICVPNLGDLSVHEGSLNKWMKLIHWLGSTFLQWTGELSLVY